jgi:hypothetical protein
VPPASVDPYAAAIEAFLDAVGAKPGDRRLLGAMLASVGALANDNAETLDLKIAASAVSEMQTAFAAFAPYRSVPKVTVFGSARTGADDPLYIQARDVATVLAEAGWMVVTGAGPGIMDQIREGDLIEVRDGALWRDGEKLAVGELLRAARRHVGADASVARRNTAGDTPEAPPPRAEGEKTKADMLVGKWKMVKHNVSGVVPYEAMEEFGPDGTVTSWTFIPNPRRAHPEGNPHIRTGTYRVEGDKLIITYVGFDIVEGPKSKVADTCVIQSISVDKLVTAYFNPKNLNDSDYPQVFEYERVQQKL